jgi:hypothetical protein
MWARSLWRVGVGGEGDGVDEEGGGGTGNNKDRRGASLSSGSKSTWHHVTRGRASGVDDDAVMLDNNLCSRLPHLCSPPPPRLQLAR